MYNVYIIVVIDCGLPLLVPGASFTDADITNTYLNAQYDFQCLTGYTLHGDNDANAGTDPFFNCDSNGNWQFGLLECRGKTLV